MEVDEATSAGVGDPLSGYDYLGYHMILRQRQYKTFCVDSADDDKLTWALQYADKIVYLRWQTFIVLPYEYPEDRRVRSLPTTPNEYANAVLNKPVDSGALYQKLKRWASTSDLKPKSVLRRGKCLDSEFFNKTRLPRSQDFFVYSDDSSSGSDTGAESDEGRYSERGRRRKAASVRTVLGRKRKRLVRGPVHRENRIPKEIIYRCINYDRSMPIEDDLVVVRNKDRIRIGSINKWHRSGVQCEKARLSGQYYRIDFNHRSEERVDEDGHMRLIEECMLIDTPYTLGDEVMRYENSERETGKNWKRMARDDVMIGRIIDIKVKCDVAILPDRKHYVMGVDKKHISKSSLTSDYELGLKRYYEWNDWVGQLLRADLNVVVEYRGFRCVVDYSEILCADEYDDRFPQAPGLEAYITMKTALRGKWEGGFVPPQVLRLAELSMERGKEEELRVFIVAVEPRVMYIFWLRSYKNISDVPPPFLVPEADIPKLRPIPDIEHPEVIARHCIEMPIDANSTIITRKQYQDGLNNEFKDCFKPMFKCGKSLQKLVQIQVSSNDGGSPPSKRRPDANAEGAENKEIKKDFGADAVIAAMKILQSAFCDKLPFLSNTDAVEGHSEDAAAGTSSITVPTPSFNSVGRVMSDVYRGLITADKEIGKVLSVETDWATLKQMFVDDAFPDDAHSDPWPICKRRPRPSSTLSIPHRVKSKTIYGVVERTHTTVDVLWMDGTVSHDVPSHELYKKESDIDIGDHLPERIITKSDSTSNSLLRFGVVRRFSNADRSCVVQWFKRENDKTPAFVMEEGEEEISTFDLKEHPRLFRIRQGDFGIKTFDDDGTPTQGSLRERLFRVEKHLHDGRQLCSFLNDTSGSLWPSQLDHFDFLYHGHNHEMEPPTPFIEDVYCDHHDENDLSDSAICNGQYNVVLSFCAQSLYLPVLQYPDEKRFTDDSIRLLVLPAVDEILKCVSAMKFDFLIDEDLTLQKACIRFLRTMSIDRVFAKAETFNDKEKAQESRSNQVLEMLSLSLSTQNFLSHYTVLMNMELDLISDGSFSGRVLEHYRRFNETFTQNEALSNACQLFTVIRDLRNAHTTACKEGNGSKDRFILFLCSGNLESYWIKRLVLSGWYSAVSPYENQPVAVGLKISKRVMVEHAMMVAVDTLLKKHKMMCRRIPIPLTEERIRTFELKSRSEYHAILQPIVSTAWTGEKEKCDYSYPIHDLRYEIMHPHASTIVFRVPCENGRTLNGELIRIGLAPASLSDMDLECVVLAALIRDVVMAVDARERLEVQKSEKYKAPLRIVVDLSDPLISIAKSPIGTATDMGIALAALCRLGAKLMPARLSDVLQWVARPEYDEVKYNCLWDMVLECLYDGLAHGRGYSLRQHIYDMDVAAHMRFHEMAIFMAAELKKDIRTNADGVNKTVYNKTPTEKEVNDAHKVVETKATQDSEVESELLNKDTDLDMDTTTQQPGTSEGAMEEIEKTPAAAVFVKGTFEVLDEFSTGHFYYSQKSVTGRRFIRAVMKEHKLLAEHVPEGCHIRTFQDRLDLWSFVIMGPHGTPYEDTPYYFEMRLPDDYPNSPPQLQYQHYAKSILNPNLYEDGKVCLSLLGTWNGENTEVWTPATSNLLQVLLSIQGLILVAEPYYNEAGYDEWKDQREMQSRSERYTEMSLVLSVEYMMNIFKSPPKLFESLIQQEIMKRWPRYQVVLKEYYQEERSVPFPVPNSKGFRLALKNAVDKMTIAVEKHIQRMEQEVVECASADDGQLAESQPPITPLSDYGRAMVYVRQNEDKEFEVFFKNREDPVDEPTQLPGVALDYTD